MIVHPYGFVNNAWKGWDEATMQKIRKESSPSKVHQPKKGPTANNDSKGSNIDTYA